ncbi:MgtC/SapB family protein [Paenibacillus taihuensis]|uniref:MgtC/SapB family protein n=1 Tax=Paenibacillus taihuensis TaxID=1156355 RepID=UPI003CCC62EB
MTTAASLWVVAAIGLTVGAGFFYCAITLTVLTVISLFLLNKWEKRFSAAKLMRELKLEIRPGSAGLQDVISELDRYGFQISQLIVDKQVASVNGSLLSVSICVKLKKTKRFVEVFSKLAEIEGIFRLETLT